MGPEGWVRQGAGVMTLSVALYRCNTNMTNTPDLCQAFFTWLWESMPALLDVHACARRHAHTHTRARIDGWVLQARAHTHTDIHTHTHTVMVPII